MEDMDSFMTWMSKKFDAQREYQDRQKLLQVAAETGEFCGISGEKLEPGERVYVATGPLLAPVRIAHGGPNRFHGKPFDTDCTNCSRPLTVDSGGSGSGGMGDRRSLRFCSSRCRDEHAKVRTRRIRPSMACKCCGETFEPSRTDAVFCSAKCKQKAHRQAKALRAAA